MARRKRSPKSISPWRAVRLSSSEDSHHTESLVKLPRCPMCPTAPPHGAPGSPTPPPVEGHEYFIDPDGTLTIKNGVCPRNLALMLFSQVSASRARYELHLGENLLKFLLNLKQIVDKHHVVCPTETPLQWANAQNVLKEYAHGSSALKGALSSSPSSPSPLASRDIDNIGSIHKSNPRKRQHQSGELARAASSERRDIDFYLADGDDGTGEDIPPHVMDPKPRPQQRAPSRERGAPRLAPDNFLEEPLPTPSPSPSHSPPPGGVKTSVPRGKDSKRSPPDSGLQALTPSGSERDPKDATSDAGSVGGASSSRVTSPAPSVSSITSSLSLAEAAKQMANTKRGSKIMPIASGDGGTRYLCPVCALELPNDHDLTVHIRSHNSQAGAAGNQAAQPNSCTICGKTLSSQSSLDRHMLVHSGERPFRCKICDMSFTTNGNMHRHARIHEKNGTAVPKPPGRKPSASSSSASASSSSKGGRSSKKESHQASQSSAYGHQDVPSSHSQPTTPSPAFPTLMTEFGSDKLDLFKSQQDQSSAFLQYYNDMSLRMGPFMFPFGSHHPAFPYQALMPDPNRMPYLPTMLDPITGEVLAKRARLAHPAMMMAAPGHTAHLSRECAREPSPDLRAQLSFACSVCPKVFTSQWSLDAHLESHVIVDEQLEAETGSAVCKICKTVAKSEESLLLHTLTHHKEDASLAEPDTKVASVKSPSPKSSSSPSPHSPASPSSPSTKSASRAASPSSKSSSKNGHSLTKSSSGSSSNGNLGFQGLNFANFTTKKFPLIAKAFCESQPEAIKGLRLPVFPCSNCALEFPVEGARDLHEVSHLPEEYTLCPSCKCHFTSSSQLQRHMLKHVADLKFDEAVRPPVAGDSRGGEGKGDEDADKEVGNGLSQGHFLAQFGLVAKDTAASAAAVFEELSGIFKDEVESNEKGGASNDGGDDESVAGNMTKDGSLVKQEAMEEEEDMEDLDQVRQPAGPDGSVSKQSRDAASVSSHREPIELSTSASSSLSPRDKSADRSRAAASLKISHSLFGGGRSALTSSSSAVTKPGGSTSSMPRSPTPPSLAGSDLGLDSRDDTSMAPMFPCKHCGVMLSSPRALKHHQRSQHESTQFRCQVCSYTSTDKSTLLRHMRTHSGERPYKCAVCDYSFTTKANCERHLRQKHGLDRDQLSGKIKCNQFVIASSSVAAVAGSADDTRLSSPFSSSLSAQQGSAAVAAHSPSTEAAGSSRCQACHVDFFSFRSLQQHLKVSPKCRMGYLCLKCKVTFSSRKSLISHMSIQHPSVPAQDYNRFTASLETIGNGADDGTDGKSSALSDFVTPPPAHAHATKPKTSPLALGQASSSAGSSPSAGVQPRQQQHLPAGLPANYLSLLPPAVIESVLLEGRAADLAKLASSSSSLSLPLSIMPGLGQTDGQDWDSNQPLDFSSTGRAKLEANPPGCVPPSKKRRHRKRQVLSSTCGGGSGSTSSEDDNDNSNDDGDDDNESVVSPEEADGPIDLTVSKTPKLPPRGVPLLPASSQSVQGLVSPVSPGLKAVTLAPGQAPLPAAPHLHPNQVEELYGVALRVWLAKTLRHP